jgi:hypothetical protein
MAIKTLQDALSKQGFTVKVDGRLGDETRAAIRQFQSQHHLPVTGEPDKATLDKLGLGNPSADSPTAQHQAIGKPPMAHGMTGRQMTAGQMQHARKEGAGETHPKQDKGMGTMGMGRMPMTPAMISCPMMSGAMTSGMAPGTAKEAPNAGMIYGMPRMSDVNLTADNVKAMIEKQLAWLANPRLKMGDLRATDAGEILAEIVTKDGSLVQRLAVDQRTGAVRQVD